MKAALVHSEEMKRYDFGPGHPFRGDRHESFMRLFRETVGTEKGIDLIAPNPATDEDLQLVHSPEYIEFIKGGVGDPWSWGGMGYVDADTPLSPGMDDAARIIVGASLLAGELVATGRYKVAISIGGGMHHARPSRGAGFCIYNDVAICVRKLRQEHRIKKILIFDTDGHAGDGTCEIFYRDPQILFISLHEDPIAQYPGTGFPHQIGEGEGKGFSVNIPLPSRTAIGPYLYALEEIFVPLAHEFRPDLILRNGGSDPHFDDQLIFLGITVDGFKRIGKKVREVAEAVCGGRIVDMVGSGYNPTVLPYAWLALVSGVSGVEVDLKEPVPPPSWLDEELGMEAVKKVIEEVKGHLSSYWKSLQKS
ncbi:MAG: hypothetical protein JSW32_00135 [Deltaproteobacteria bacterium]|nr:MAG: hypothetical protein JSW32_00135 [Deltaproteobacteria bacterium]